MSAEIIPATDSFIAMFEDVLKLVSRIFPINQKYFHIK